MTRGQNKGTQKPGLDLWLPLVYRSKGTSQALKSQHGIGLLKCIALATQGTGNSNGQTSTSEPAGVCWITWHARQGMWEFPAQKHPQVLLHPRSQIPGMGLTGRGAVPRFLIPSAELPREPLKFPELCSCFPDSQNPRMVLVGQGLEQPGRVKMSLSMAGVGWDNGMG